MKRNNKIGLTLCLTLLITLLMYMMSVNADLVKFQYITGYSSPEGSSGSSGNMPYIGSSAVHSSVKGNPFQPIYPYGTQITLTQSIPMYNGTNRTLFTVEDTGDIDWKRYNEGRVTWQWLDTWHGTGPKGGPIDQWLINEFGTKVRDYNVNL